MSKPIEDRAKKRSVSAPVELWEKADARWRTLKRLNIKNISQYVQWLMRKDAEAHGITTAPNPKTVSLDQTKEILDKNRRSKAASK